MSVTRPQPSLGETIYLARRIAEMPESQIPQAIGEMMYRRELFRTVSALDDLVRERPEYGPVAVKALRKMQLWRAG